MKNDFIGLIVTLIIGVLVYSIISFAYMHSTFTTNDSMDTQSQRLSRIENRTDVRLKSIEEKLDKIILGLK